MTGILKVDTIQKNNGATPTAADLGLNVSGSVIQVVEYHSTSAITINSSAIKCFDQSITTKMTNSSILVLLTVGRSGQNADVDIALAMGYKTGNASSSSADYTSLHGSSYSRELIPSLGSFWAQDTSDPNGGNWNGVYAVSAINFQKKHSPNVVAGTTLNYSLWGSSDGTFYIGRANGGSTDNGYDTSLVIMEIAG